MTLTGNQIEELITCSKRVATAPARSFKEENRHRRKDMGLEATLDPKGVFEVFIRQSLEFAEDFSLGLVYHSLDGKRMTLIRYNGQHEQTNNPLDQAKPHFQYHVHTATADNLNNGRYDKHPAAPTPEYASFEEATGAFLARIGLEQSDVAEYFPNLSEQLLLFRKPEDRQ
jgi:hypothetical protein